MLPSSSMAPLVSGRLLIRSLGTIGFRDITETNGRESITVTSPRTIWEFVQGRTGREKVA